MDFKEYIQKFYFNGFLIGKLREDENYENFHNKIKDISDNINKYNYFERINETVLSNKSNMEESLEFHKKNDIFIKIILENGIHNLIKDLFGKQMSLVQIGIRKSEKEKNFLKKIIKPWGYIQPHRDSYYNKNEWWGESPPGCKIIFYPQLNSKNNKMLSIYPGSHRKMTSFKNGKIIDILRSFIDTSFQIKQSSNKFLIKNSSIRHTVSKENNPEGSIRIIYFFEDPCNAHNNILDKYYQKLLLNHNN